MKSELGYWRDLAIKAFNHDRICMEQIKELLGESDEEISDEEIREEAERDFDISEEEYSYLLTTTPEKAYEIYAKGRNLI